MKKNRVSLTERKGTDPKQSHTSMQKKPKQTNPRIMRKILSVNMVRARSVKEQKAKEKTLEEQSVPAKKTDLETPDQSTEAIERKTTESTPMPNTVKTRKEHHRVLINRQSRRGNQHTKDDKRRLTSEENVVH